MTTKNTKVFRGIVPPTPSGKRLPRSIVNRASNGLHKDLLYEKSLGSPQLSVTGFGFFG